jgi:uncharacterized membrane protein YgcG
MNKQTRTSFSSRPRTRRAFTLVELIVAGMAALLVIGAVTISLFQSARARATTKTRLVAYSRANTALDILRREIASVIRRTDLFETRLLVYDDAITNQNGEFDRDELLLFNTSLRPTRPNEYSGEGQEYESQFRIGEDKTGIAMWQRRDSVPDEWSDAGGLAIPVTLGIVGLKVEAYDGEAWFDEWDSDLDGLPWAIRLTVTAEGTGPGREENDDPGHFATLRTQVAIDRIVPPPPPEPEEEEEGEEGEGAGEEGEDDGSSGSGGSSSGRPGGSPETSVGGDSRGSGRGGSDYPGPGPGRGSRGGRPNPGSGGGNGPPREGGGGR